MFTGTGDPITGRRAGILTFGVADSRAFVPSGSPGRSGPGSGWPKSSRSSLECPITRPMWAGFSGVAASASRNRRSGPPSGTRRPSGTGGSNASPSSKKGSSRGESHPVGRRIGVLPAARSVAHLGAGGQDPGNSAQAEPRAPERHQRCQHHWRTVPGGAGPLL